MPMGYGHYRIANSAAMGVFYRPNESIMYNIGGTLGNGSSRSAGGAFLFTGSAPVSFTRSAGPW